MRRYVLRICHSLCLLAALAFACAHAATITVNSNAATATAGDGAVTLREAIDAINSGSTADPDIIAQVPGTFGVNDTINFNIPGAGVHVITPAFALIINKTVTINGYSQPGSSANTNPVGQGLNTVLQIQLAGANGLLGANGAPSSGTIIRGLVVPSVTFSNGSSGNKVEGSFIGTNATGTAASGACNTGVVFASANNTVGGNTPAARNLISGCGNAGVGFSISAGQDNNVIQGNLIGTNPAGTAAVPNGVGVFTSGGANGTIIGGTVAGAGNVISGNTNGGILLGGNGTGAIVQGNFIGTDVTGTVALGNTISGIVLQDQQANALIGGTAAGAGNLISGNGQYGIALNSGNTVQGNRIGTNAAGTAVLGVQTSGITVFGSNNRIGGTAAGAGNVIAFNSTGIGPNGIGVQPNTTGNSFNTNSIHDNGGTGGIVMGFPLPNQSVAQPTLTSATINAGNVTISGQVNAVLATNATFRLEFFSNIVCDASGNGEGRTFLGAQNVTSNASGQIPSFGPFTFAVPAGQPVFTATLTSNPGAAGAVIVPGAQPQGVIGPETSKFSMCASVAAPVPPPQFMKSFAPSTIAVNGTSTLTFTINNIAPGNAALTGVAFTDTLPAGVIVATPNGLTGSCGSGTVTATAGSGSIALSGGTLAAGSSCTFSVNVTATTSGSKANNTGPISSNESSQGLNASADLNVTAGVTPPTIAKSFAPTSIPLNGNTTLSFTLTNPSATATLNNMGFVDTLPAGLVVATPNGLSGACGNGTITAAAGSGTISLSGTTASPGATCTFSVKVTGTTAGTKNNSVTVTSTEATGNTATASVTVTSVVPATLTKAFGSPTVSTGGVTTLTFTLTNPNSSGALTGVGFTDTFPGGLVVSTPNGLTGTCGGGTITAVAGSNSVSLSGASLAASATCAFTVNATATGSGTQNNVTSAVTSVEAGNGGTATASLVIAAPPAANIPTLQQWALALLAFLLSISAVRLFLRRGTR